MREFVRLAALEIGLTLEFKGEGLDEHAVVVSIDVDKINSILADRHIARLSLKPGDMVVKIDPRYFRPTEVETLLGDASKAKAKLGWEPEISFEELVREMAREDLLLAAKDRIVNDAGFVVYEPQE